MGAAGPTLKQRLSVASYIYFIPVCIFLNVLMLCNRWTALIWFLYVLYINVGPGRHAAKTGSWPKLLRKWGWWRHCAEYFPVDLVKTADLDPEGRYIFVIHPHGIVTMFAWPCFDTDPTGFSAKFPGIDLHPMTLEVNFRLPFMREWLLLHGVVDASAASCLLVLGRGSGSSILLAVGGAQESLLAEQGTYDLVLNKRKGFVRIALQTGAQLVPVIGFGENELYTTRKPTPGSWRARWAAVLKRCFGFTLPDAEGNSLLFGKTGLMPYPKPLNVVVGAPLTMDASQLLKQTEGQELGLDKFVEVYHKQYCTALRQLWDKHKGRYAAERRRSLTIVE